MRSCDRNGINNCVMKDFFNLLFEQKNIIGIGYVFLGLAGPAILLEFEERGIIGPTEFYYLIFIFGILWTLGFLWMIKKWM